MFLKNSDNVGRLEVICGSMFSGKSEELIRRLRRIPYTKQNVLIFKHSIDQRYGQKDIFSHSKYSIEAIPVTNVFEMEEIIVKYPDVEVIGIDEVQFFGQDVVDFCLKYVDLGKRIIVAGLDLDFKAEPFYPMPLLMAYADEITKLKAICTICGKEAYASQRLINSSPAYVDDPLVLVGASENYEARCRRHHIVKNRNNKRGNIYFIYGTSIDAGKTDVQQYIINQNEGKTFNTIKLFENLDTVSNLRNIINESSLNYDVTFVRIVKTPLLPIEGDYTIIDLISEFRKISSIILVSRNRRGMINELLISYEIIKQADLNFYGLFYTYSENLEKEENLKQINEILNIEPINLY